MHATGWLWSRPTLVKCLPRVTLFAVARGAASLNVPLILSTASSKAEDVSVAMGWTPRWCQLYWPKDPEPAKSFIKRTEASSYSALVVTLTRRCFRGASAIFRMPTCRSSSSTDWRTTFLVAYTGPH